MLIFVKGCYEGLIAAGEKTTTVRLWKSCRLQPGDPLSFNGRVRATITAVEQRRLGDLDDRDALADGFPSQSAFRRAFREYYPLASLDSPVTVLHSKPAVSRSVARFIPPTLPVLVPMSCISLALDRGDMRGGRTMFQSGDLAQCATTAGWAAVRNTCFALVRRTLLTKSASATPIPTP
jgi:ASC-1-like (ASCH) protein